jgi:hypothetical protein
VDKTVSTTDPDAGKLGRPGKPHGMHYLNHQTLDSKNGIILDAEATPANVVDSAPYLGRLEHVLGRTGLSIEAVALDSGYDISLIHKELETMGITLFVPECGKGGWRRTEFGSESFRYDESDDAFLCPRGCRLPLRGLERGESNIMRRYATTNADCRGCPDREKCLSPSQKARTIRVNIFQDAVDRSRERCGTPEYRRAMALRQIWSEGTFGNQVSKHKMRNLARRGLEAANDHCLLSATVMNLKRMARLVAQGSPCPSLLISWLKTKMAGLKMVFLGFVNSPQCLKKALFERSLLVTVHSSTSREVFCAVFAQNPEFCKRQTAFFAVCVHREACC